MCYIAIGVAHWGFLHSLPFHILCYHSKSTISNPFGFEACGLSAGSCRMEIFRVFDGLTIGCISVVCKYIGD